MKLTYEERLELKRRINVAKRLRILGTSYSGPALVNKLTVEDASVRKSTKEELRREKRNAVSKAFYYKNKENRFTKNGFKRVSDDEIECLTCGRISNKFSNQHKRHNPDCPAKPVTK